MSIQPSSSKAEESAAIICRNIYKTYGTGEASVPAVQGVSLEINKGELRLLMGPSGSGKTTLISIISGILSQDSGVCLLNGVDLIKLSDQEKTAFRGIHVGFVFQVFNLVPTISIEENVCIPLLLQGCKREVAIERAKEVLSSLEMSDKIGKSPTELSGGQQQRVAIARAFVHSPEFIVCDEPTSFLDHRTGTKIMEQLQKLARDHNATVVVVTHDPRILPFADKIDRLEDGRIVASN